jgi:hypothetical protein
MASIYNLAVDQGTTFLATIQVNDTTGSARDLSGYNGRSQLRRSYFSTSNVEFTVSITSPADGEVKISLTSAQTANLRYGRYVYDVELVETASGNVERILEGIVTVYPEVTK